ncbi:uncharacterized protein LOC129407511 isoform X1 [Boleophthalmus pectinirostris]|uniref:uncharacterized protein LOC129407511 isoform X1 n=1 Tax=Boleophthalmus pectinirostris TaxID=150288 RepID=UPI00242E3012|nr:uncharacterized protein LOC129407511 isoform X1 [Boleophthalmus pectinirostris]
MESHKQGQTLQIGMERLKEEPSAEPVPPQSSSCLKRSNVLVSMVSLVTIISTCLLFFFMFGPACAQVSFSHSVSDTDESVHEFKFYQYSFCNLKKDIQPTASAARKIHNRSWLQETKQHYEIFQAKKYCKYLIHGWLRQSTNDHSGDVQLVHRDDSKNSTLQTERSKSVVFFGTEVQLFKTSSVHLHCTSQLTDGYFFIHELSEFCPGD